MNFMNYLPKLGYGGLSVVQFGSNYRIRGLLEKSNRRLVFRSVVCIFLAPGSLIIYDPSSIPKWLNQTEPNVEPSDVSETFEQICLVRVKGISVKLAAMCFSRAMGLTRRNHRLEHQNCH